MAIGCGATCAKIILIIYNIIFLLTGIALIAVGVWLFVSGTIPGLITLTYNGTDSALFRNSAILLIAMGVFVIVVSVLGFVGAILENTIMLGIYIGLLIIIFCVEIAGGVLAIVFKDQIVYSLTTTLANALAPQLNQSSSTHYYNLNANGTVCYTSDEGYAWDYVQITFSCCGIENGNTGYQSLTPAYNFQTMCPGLKTQYIPLSCCQFNSTEATFGQFHQVPDNQYNVQNLVNCNNPNTNGCANSLATQIQKYAPILIGIGIGFAMLELFGIIFAVCLCRNVGEDY